jgi:uncharacterized protein YxeA
MNMKKIIIVFLSLFFIGCTNVYVWYLDNFDKYDGLDAVYLGIDNSYTYSVKDAYIFLEYDFTNGDAAKNFLDDVLYYYNLCIK